MPSQLEKEDALLLLDIMELRSYARAKELVMRDDTDEEALGKMGLPEASISRVMANIERMAAHD